jgi:hypothetical protein
VSLETRPPPLERRTDGGWLCDVRGWCRRCGDTRPVAMGIRWLLPRQASSRIRRAVFTPLCDDCTQWAWLVLRQPYRPVWYPPWHPMDGVVPLGPDAMAELHATGGELAPRGVQNRHTPQMTGRHTWHSEKVG